MNDRADALQAAGLQLQGHLEIILEFFADCRRKEMQGAGLPGYDRKIHQANLERLRHLRNTAETLEEMSAFVPRTLDPYKIVHHWKKFLRMFDGVYTPDEPMRARLDNSLAYMERHLPGAEDYLPWTHVLEYPLTFTRFADELVMEWSRKGLHLSV